MPQSRKFTFEVPPDLSQIMATHPEVNWTAVFRGAIRRHAEAADVAARIVEEQADPRIQAVAAGLKAGIAARYRKETATRRAAAKR